MHLRSLFVAALAVLLLVCPAAPGSAGTDVKVNSDPPGTVQNEVRITRNATDANNFAVAHNDAIGAAASPLGISFTTDGGVTWADRQLSIPKHPVMGTPDDNLAFNSIFDPYIDSDPAGNIYAGYIANAGYPGPNGIYIERSTDKGNSWSGPTNIAFNLRAANPTDPNYRFNDRPDMTVDPSGNVVVVWIKDVGLTAPTSDIYFARSGPPGLPGPASPTGLDFTGTTAGSVAPKTINDNPNGTDWANVPDVAVASDGTIYVSWINVDVTNPLIKPGTLMLDRSTDNGATFGADRQVLAITALPKWLHQADGTNDAWAGSYPVLGVHPTNPLEIYMAYAAAAASGDEGDIFFIRSADGGATWSTPLRINTDATLNDQFHPVMAVAPNGRIDLAWYDKRHSATDGHWDVYLATSWNGGLTFGPEVRISDQTYATPTDAWGQGWMGEYFGLEVDNATAFLAFTSSVADAFGDIYFDTLARPVVRCQGKAASIVGSAGPDTLTGTAGADVIAGLNGNDTLSGLGGGDTICGGRGVDLIHGGSGNDLLDGGGGRDTVYGDGGYDHLLGGARNDQLRGGPGNDVIAGGLGNDRLFGETGDDAMVGNGGRDRLNGGRGSDYLDGGAGADTCVGGEILVSC